MRSKENAATDRALLVLHRESQRAADAAERVRLVIEAVALRRGVISPRPIAKQTVDRDFEFGC